MSRLFISLVKYRNLLPPIHYSFQFLVNDGNVHGALTNRHTGSALTHSQDVFTFRTVTARCCYIESRREPVTKSFSLRCLHEKRAYPRMHSIVGGTLRFPLLKGET